MRRHEDTAPPNDDRLATVRRFMGERIPLHRWLGVEVTELGPGRATLAVPFRAELVGDPDRPALHGGVLSALADAAGGAAVWTQIGPHDRVSTIDLRVDYLRPARLERFEARAVVLRVGNRVGVADVTLVHPGDEQPIAEAKGVYSVKRVSE
jgi:uncharacterized protein (TIGR00369 family)